MGFLKFSQPPLCAQIITRLLVVAFSVAIATISFSLPPELAIAATLPDLPSSSQQILPATQVALQSSPQPETHGSFVAAAVKRVGPAVVRIDTERTVTRSLDRFYDDPLFGRFFGDDLRSQIPRSERLRGQGSGFIIDRSGIVLTNAHVVDRADKVTVTLNDGTTYTGKVLGTDEITDLAAVKITTPSSNLPIASLGDSDAVQVGDWAIAVGNPLGFDNTVTLGIISTLKRSSAAVGIPDKRLDFIQTDAAINPGNSGGPLLNESGEVIGINTAIRPDAMGIGFAIPINKAKTIIVQLAKGEEVSHPFLGIQMVTLTPEIARENNTDPNAPFRVLEINGVLVMRVMPDTPALKAGIRSGDVIVGIDNESVTSAAQIQNIVENSKVGQTLKLKVRRLDLTKEIYVTTAQLK
ncbi:HhoA/HhoB/HtrA family serine endopeptidase [Kamptonema sp. UHCC 0994]|uniref:HhoA/HhoB/HtrA family serine endopeptidase n=1 Tax=Kamptonema sp. UHCC 0994 TaxID=3031329 RepID=UPI0023B92C4C|nr:HhoA/HhoB/HtrA family serine endopeptidase [Kamptonema sp. UHCC 0994]MDF0555352.1 HhoA/HhoB/HtrA family serine endopeptidase [Kamptonema sp. UHCC 0994]